MVKISLAARTDPEELELVGDGLEAVASRNFFLEFAGKALVNFHHPAAAGADQVMVVAIVPFSQQLEPRDAVPQIKAFDDFHPLQQVHRTINRGEVAFVPWEGREDFLVGKRVRLMAEYLQNRLTRPGDFVRLTAQPLGQPRQG